MTKEEYDRLLKSDYWKEILGLTVLMNLWFYVRIRKI